jgi:K+-sensing histidine kinase KdpD
MIDTWEARQSAPMTSLPIANNQAQERRPLPLAARCLLALVLVGVATLLAFPLSQLVSAANLALIYVLPVVIVATAFGWGPSLVAVLVSILSFDFFFTRPYFTLRMTEPSEMWAASLLLVTATIVSAVAGEARRRALESRRAADQAGALHALAHEVIRGRPRPEIERAAATALSRIFAAPAAVFVKRDSDPLRAEAAGGANISSADSLAATSAMESHLHLRGDTYPNDQSGFDLWPVQSSTGCLYVLGVDFIHATDDRPADPERFIEMVAAYLTVRPA